MVIDIIENIKLFFEHVVLDITLKPEVQGLWWPRRSWPTWLRWESVLKIQLFKQSLVYIWTLLCDQDADRDGSGSMDFQEFVEMMIKVKWKFWFDYQHSLAERIREGDSPGTETGFSSFWQGWHNYSAFGWLPFWGWVFSSCPCPYVEY